MYPGNWELRVTALLATIAWVVVPTTRPPQNRAIFFNEPNSQPPKSNSQSEKVVWPDLLFAGEMWFWIGADVESFLQMVSWFNSIAQLLVLIGIEQRKSHGIVTSVSHASHHVQHHSMRTTCVVAFQSPFVAQIWDSCFCSKNCHHKSFCILVKNILKLILK